MRPFAPLLLIFFIASACASSVSEKERASARIRYDIGVASMNQGDMRAALRELLAAVEMDPELATAHNALGLVFHSMGRLEDALEHYNKAVELDPGFSEAHNNRGALLMDMQRYDEAVTAFEKALSDILYATPSLAEGNLGWAYYKKGEREQGLRHLRNAVASNPKFCRGYDWLSQIEMESNRPDQVVAYCRRFEEHCVRDESISAGLPPPLVREMSYRLGWGYARLGERDKAREVLSVCAGRAEQDEAALRCRRLLSSLE